MECRSNHRKKRFSKERARSLKQSQKNRFFSRIENIEWDNKGQRQSQREWQLNAPMKVTNKHFVLGIQFKDLFLMGMEKCVVGTVHIDVFRFDSYKISIQYRFSISLTSTKSISSGCFLGYGKRILEDSGVYTTAVGYCR